MTYRSRVVDRIATTFPQLKDVKPHPGKFTVEDIRRLCLKSPSAHVAILNVPEEKAGDLATGEGVYNANVATFIATRHTAREKADELGWRLAEMVAVLARYNYFGSPVFPAFNVEIENLWSAEQDHEWMCIMGVCWTQPFVLGTNWTALLLQVKRGVSVTFPDHLVITPDVEMGAPQPINVFDPSNPFEILPGRS
jgi:hypothetical protein